MKDYVPLKVNKNTREELFKLKQFNGRETTDDLINRLLNERKNISINNQKGVSFDETKRIYITYGKIKTGKTSFLFAPVYSPHVISPRSVRNDLNTKFTIIVDCTDLNQANEIASMLKKEDALIKLIDLGTVLSQ